jgi:transposase-like protein
MDANDDGNGESPEARRRLVRAILEGRATRRGAARALGVSVQTVRRWVERERGSLFVAVDAVGCGEARTVEVVVRGGRALRAPSDLEASELVRLVRALESC